MLPRSRIKEYQQPNSAHSTKGGPAIGLPVQTELWEHTETKETGVTFLPEIVRPSLIRRTNKGPNLEIFSQVPHRSAWLREGLVERQLSVTVWQPRRMILTSKEVLFVKESSSAVVDRLPLRAITFIGRVNLAQSVRRHPAAVLTTLPSQPLQSLHNISERPSSIPL